MDTVADIYMWFMSELGENAFAEPDDPTVHNRLVDMYHAATDKDSQERIANNIVDPSSSLRCLVATVAFGLGINLPDVEEVIHWGPTGDIMSFWQEVGRCARDGRQGRGTLFLYPRSVDKRRVDETMRKLLSNVKHSEVCFRKGILEHLYLPEMDRAMFDKALQNQRCCCVCMRSQHQIK